MFDTNKLKKKQVSEFNDKVLLETKSEFAVSILYGCINY